MMTTRHYPLSQHNTYGKYQHWRSHGWARAHPTSARVGREICTNSRSFLDESGWGGSRLSMNRKVHHIFNEHIIMSLLILRKMIKIVATRCHILRLKCTKFDFGWGSVPDPAGGPHNAPSDPLAGFKRFYF